MMQQLASSVCCRRLSWKLRRSRVEVVASMRKRSRDSNGIWLATWRRAQSFSNLSRAGQRAVHASLWLCGENGAMSCAALAF